MEMENSKFNASNFIRSKKLKVLSSSRIKYESESLYIRSKLGGLENVQKTLGLSGRKICQLLLVDPSCWSRWQKDESKVPPSVWKTLEWYLLLREKHPFWSEKEQLLVGTKVESVDQPKSWKFHPLLIVVFMWSTLMTLGMLFVLFK